MKKAEWQAVYAPQGDALERRVRTTLDGLADRPERAYPRRAVFVAAALVLALIAAAAVAAGLTRSARYDAKRLAYQALEEKYGFTTDMESFFTCTAEEKDGQTVVTYRANAVEDEYGNTPAQRAELDWLLYHKPLEYAQLVLSGEIEHYLSLGCDHGRMED